MFISPSPAFLDVSENMGKPPNHPMFNRVWNHDFHHPLWGVLVPLFLGNTIFSLGSKTCWLSCFLTGARENAQVRMESFHPFGVVITRRWCERRGFQQLIVGEHDICRPWNLMVGVRNIISYWNVSTFFLGDNVNFPGGYFLASGVLHRSFQVCHERWLFLIMLCAEVPREHQPSAVVLWGLGGFVSKHGWLIRF